MIIANKKNSAFELTFPMVDSTTPASFKTGLSPVDTAYYKDGAGAWTTLAITDTAAEIGTTGIYGISLTAAEMNHDWVNIKFTASGAADTLITFKMFTDPITIWHVAKTGSDNNNGHSYEYAKLTIGAAVTASASGDKIIIWPGDYDETVDLATAGKSLTLEGISRQLSRIIRTGSSQTCICLENNTTLKNLAVSATSTGCIGIQGIAKNHIVFEGCDLTGTLDVMTLAASCADILMKNCILKGTYDVFVFNGGSRIIVEDSIFYTDGTYATAVNIRAVLGYGDSDAIFNNCSFVVSRNNSTAAQYIAGVVGYTLSQITLNNCSIKISAVTPDAGGVYGIYAKDADSKVVVNNCSIVTSTTGTGTAYDLYNSAGKICVSSSYYDPAKVSGTIIEGGGGFAAALNAATPASVVGNVGGNVVGSIGSLAVQAQEDVGEITDAIINANTTIGTIKTDIETTGVVVKDLTTNAKALIQTEAEDAVVAKNLDHFTARTANAQAGGANTITLDTQSSSTDNYYNGRTILITAGTGAGQIRRIVSYNGTTKVATVDSNWSLQPVNGSEFLILNLYDAEVTAIKAKTDNLPADPADDSDIDAQLAAIKTDSAAILLDTGTDGVIVNDLTVAAKALIQTEAEDALIAKDLDHIVKTTAGAEKPTDGSYLDKIMNKNVSQTFDDTTDSLEAIRDNQAGADAAAIADAVWDETMTGHIDAGKAGAQIWTDIDAILTDTTAMKATIIKLETTLVMDGAVYQFTANALELAPGGGGDLLGGIVEGTITVKEALSIFLAILSGKSSGGGTATIIFRDTADTKNRLVVTVDAKGNRTAIITRDGT